MAGRCRTTREWIADTGGMGDSLPNQEGDTSIESNESTICMRCCQFLGQIANPQASTRACSVCLGLWHHNDRLQSDIKRACALYGGVGDNRFSTEHPPTVVIPGDVALRYHLASQDSGSAKPTNIFIRELKSHLKAGVLSYLQQNQSQTFGVKNPSFMAAEEQGFLCVHIHITTAEGVERPAGFSIFQNTRRTRKRFRGHDPTEKQGGNPITNLEKRLSKKYGNLWTVQDVETALERGVSPSVQAWFQTASARVPRQALQLHVAVWRRPFFVRGLYTKSRRDVSQTPFYVPSDDNKAAMVRKGVTSVEEQITPFLAKLGCRKISTSNNDPDSPDVVFGMIKFHASGREDMDVRMLLPPEPTENVGGRPFVCQVIDAELMPNQGDLDEVQQAVNTEGSLSLEETQQRELNGSNSDLHHRTYGRNPMGVSISGGKSECITFAPARSFKNLQGETEEKVKYYGCLCWSASKIESEEQLIQSLGSYPLEIKQKTPIRVLHRRSNLTRTRHVLTLKATRIDEHYFRLHLSTDAGTYVKEFVHGDLGRCIPSVSSLLGCKTDILELDCEGIQGV